MILSLILFQFGCVKEQPLAAADYLLITDEELATLNGPSSWETVEKKERYSKDKNLFYFTNMFFEDDEFYYGKTCIDKSGKVYLEKISKDPVQVTRKEFDYGDTDCMAFNGTELLTTANRFRELVICRYDKNLDLIEEHSLKWIQEQNVEGFRCWQILPFNEGWIFLISIHPSGTDSFYNENHLLFLDSEFQVQSDYDLGFYDGAYSSFVLLEDLVYLNRYAQKDPNSFETMYPNIIDVFSLESHAIVNSYTLPYTTNGSFVQNAPDGVLVLERTSAQTDRHIPIVLLWPETGEVVPVVIDYEYPYASGPNPFISVDQDRIYFTYRAVIYSYCLTDRTLGTVNLEELGFSDYLLFLKCSTS
ncbi:hypothetical protein [Allobaculum sp. JKK-2023]|uniref:hypothetical protein n=1 Tax=Allobaculum sp. JKK-2023 TaxID=3108943 RepID=UPI002B05EE4C|nr:hypothetical protein [Allobaculum sp. JKK-2023]